MWRKSSPSVAGFTLIELLVILAIIIILMGLLFPAFFAAEEKADRADCLNNVRQIAAATQVQFGDLGEFLPSRSAGDAFGEAAEALLPYLRNIKDVFKCPASPGRTDAILKMPSYEFYVDYELNGFLCAVTGDTEWRRQNMIEDFSLAACAYDFPFDPTDDTRSHAGGINVGYLDGHAAWLSDDDMGDVTTAGDDGSEFFTKGHRIWEMN